MRTYGFKLAGVLILLLISSSLLAKDDLKSLRKRFDRDNSILAKAKIEGDFETMASFYVDDIIMMPNFHEIIRGKKDWIRLERKAQRAGRKIRSLNFTILELWTCEDYVYELGQYAETMTYPNLSHPIADHGTYLSISQKQPDGSYKGKVVIANTDLKLDELIRQMK